MKTVIKNLKKIYTSKGKNALTGSDQNTIRIYCNNDIEIENGIIKKITPNISTENDVHIIDGQGCIAIPGFVESHTHPIFFGTREDEFVNRIKGIDYEKMTEKGGGINYSIKKTRDASDKELSDTLKRNIRKFIKNGVTTFEAKSGYALTKEGELRLLKILNQYKQETELDMKITYLGGHLLPKGRKKDDFISEVIETIKIVGQRGLADYFDVWVEKIAFNRDDAALMINEALKNDLKIRIHTNELSCFGGGLLANDLDISSFDHFDFYSEEELNIIAKKGINVTLLPLTQFSLGEENYPNGKKLIKRHIPISLSTDFNPGTSYSSNIQFLAQLAFLKCNMNINEIINGLTINPAVSLGLGDRLGSIEVGKQGDILIMSIPNLESIFYSIGMNNILYTIKKGKIIYRRNI